MAVYKKWKQEEVDFIRENHEIIRDNEMAVKLSQITGEIITTAMIRRQRRKMKLKKKQGRPKKNGAVSIESMDQAS